MTSPSLKKLLIVVHPGSACGSADMNLGYDNASEQRGFLQSEIDDWQGPVVVFDGEFSDQLDDGFKREWSELGRAVTDALARAKAAGQPSIRMMADDDSDFNQEAAAAQIVSTLGLTPDCDINLTGAWYHSSDGGGCVGSVKDVLEGLGLRVRLGDPIDFDADCDLDEDDECDPDEDDEAQDEVEPAPPSIRTPRGPR